MPCNPKDISILRDLAKQYVDLAARPIQEERRRLWSKHLSLKRTRAPILVEYGMHNVWCREVFSDTAMECQDPFYREHERWLRMQIFHGSVGDDYILEPWIPQRAVYRTPVGMFGEPWGAGVTRRQPGVEGGAYKAEPFIRNWQDTARLVVPHHQIDEETTAHQAQRLRDAVGDILEVDVDRRPVLLDYAADISTTVAALRGLEQLMLDMYEAPGRLHQLLAFLRDGILMNQEEAEKAGDFSLTTQRNQAMPYAEELERPRANSGPRRRSELWGYCAAQEYTLISPEFHDEFLFQYQMPIMERFGLVSFGCCENLTAKINMLRQLKNLRCIAVTPCADLRRCAEQVGTDYVISWRPNPTDMVCAAWDERWIRRMLHDGLDVCRGGFMHILLKDIETVQGDPGRLARWAHIAREVAEE